jgi:hypothetical protein
MDRNENREDDVIDLGVASIETKGGGNHSMDQNFQQIPQLGIADD